MELSRELLKVPSGSPIWMRSPERRGWEEGEERKGGVNTDLFHMKRTNTFFLLLLIRTNLYAATQNNFK